MSKLRWLLAISCTVGACADATSVDVGDPQGLGAWDPEPTPLREVRPGEVRVRVVSGNITSGTKQSYLDPGIRIFRGLKADIALVQEMNYGANSATDLRRFVDQAFGPDFVYFREPGGVQIPNGVVSRFPILDSGVIDDTLVSNRSFVWARLDVPGPVDMVAISVHLLTSSQTSRLAEANQLVDAIRMFPGDYVVLGGDFNTTVREEPAVVSLSEVLVTAGPYPVDLLGNSGTNASRAKPYDWVVGDAELTAREIPVTIGLNSFPSGFVADTRVYQPIADLAPALQSDSAATAMQHMAVVRDFALPVDGPLASITVSAPNGGETWTAGSSQEISWVAEGVTEVEVALTLDGVSWTVLDDSADAAAGKISWVVPAQATSAARIRVTAVAGSGGDVSDVSDTAFNITVPPPPPPMVARVLINEVLANEAGSDTNGEFVEIVNAGNAEADLSGWTLSDAGAVRHVFPAGTRLGAWKAIVVYGSAAGIPAGVPGAVASSTRSLSLTNGGDSVTLSKSGTIVDRVSYSSSLSGTDGVSMTRRTDGDPAASFMLHGSGRPRSPGTRADGSAF